MKTDRDSGDGLNYSIWEKISNPLRKHWESIGQLSALLLAMQTCKFCWYKYFDGLNLLSPCSRTLVVTNQVLKEYKQMIAGTTDKLEMHLEKLDDNLESLPPQRRVSSSNDATERVPMELERDSTKQCLDICAQVLMHISNVQPNNF